MPTSLSTAGYLLFLLLISYDGSFIGAADAEHDLRATDLHNHRHRRHRSHRRGEEFEYSAISCRAYSASLDEFGAVGDGVTSNTAAFRDAVSQLSRFADYGGSLLFVPAGRWLTGSFNLTSHFTLFLHRDAVILASQEESDYEVIEPLPSYGRGRDTDGGRFISLLFGSNLTDVVITGENGTIDGQGEPWWGKFKRGELKYTRPYLIEIMHSDGIQISNLTFLNSPSWHIHPVYSRNIFIQGLTILAPVTVPNTDGINPDSCTNTRIEDCYIVSGDDCIAVKSGWDQYGINYGMPTKQLLIRRLTCISPDSAVIALGSEMSGGIEDVRAEDIVAINSESGIRIKTAIGRGGYVKDVYVRGMTMQTMKYVFWMTGSYGSHPDEHYDPKALPVIQNINYQDMVAENVTMPAQLAGISGDQFTGICISNVTITLSKKPKKVLWNCTDVSGYTSGVTPQPCQLLPEKQPGTIVHKNKTIFQKKQKQSMKPNQNRFLRIISTPLRALGKARDFYVRSITGCAARTQYSSSASVSAPFPRSRSSSSAAFSSSASSRRATDFGIDEDYSELVRAASVRSLGHKNEIDMLLQEKLQQQRQQKQGGLPKSSSVGMAKIEEEEETEEGSVNPKMKKTKKVSDLLYPRSKSYAVTGSPKL